MARGKAIAKKIPTEVARVRAEAAAQDALDDLAAIEAAMDAPPAAPKARKYRPKKKRHLRQPNTPMIMTEADHRDANRDLLAAKGHSLPISHAIEALDDEMNETDIYVAKPVTASKSMRGRITRLGEFGSSYTEVERTLAKSEDPVNAGNPEDMNLVFPHGTETAKEAITKSALKRIERRAGLIRSNLHTLRDETILSLGIWLVPVIQRMCMLALFDKVITIRPSHVYSAIAVSHGQKIYHVAAVKAIDIERRNNLKRFNKGIRTKRTHHIELKDYEVRKLRQQARGYELLARARK